MPPLFSLESLAALLALTGIEIVLYDEEDS